MKYTASKIQIHSLKKRLKKSIESGDFSNFVRAQSLLRIDCSNNSIEAVDSQAGKSHECVRQWLSAFLEKGVKSLKIKSPAGRRPKLSKSQCKELK